LQAARQYLHSVAGKHHALPFIAGRTRGQVDKTKETRVTSNLLMCEFHDASIESLQFDLPDRLVMVFGGLNCFYQSNESHIADVWACRATLTFAGFDHAMLSLPVSPDALVSDANFLFEDPASTDKYNLPLLHGIACIRSQMIFDSGGEVTILAGHASLTLNGQIRFLEQFDWLQKNE
jgi:hypothetical protein